MMVNYHIFLNLSMEGEYRHPKYMPTTGDHKIQVVATERHYPDSWHLLETTDRCPRWNSASFAFPPLGIFLRDIVYHAAVKINIIAVLVLGVSTHITFSVLMEEKNQLEPSFCSRSWKITKVQYRQTSDKHRSDKLLALGSQEKQISLTGLASHSTLLYIFIKFPNNKFDLWSGSFNTV